jgi:hypothetical protein
LMLLLHRPLCTLPLLVLLSLWPALFFTLLPVLRVDRSGNSKN